MKRFVFIRAAVLLAIGAGALYAPLANAALTDYLQGEIDKKVEANGGKSLLPDVTAGHPNYYSISYLFNIGVIKGYPDGTFKPDNDVNRAELVKMVVEQLKQTSKDEGLNDTINLDPAKYKNCFPDVKEEWFAPYICYAKEKGWVAGYPDGYYRPANNVNRVEAIKIAVNSLLSEREIPTPTEEQKALPMPSDADMSAWYGGYLRFTIVYELLDGWHVTQNPDGSYQYYPSGNMTRKEVAEMLYRIMVYRAERYTFRVLVVGAACMLQEFGAEAAENGSQEELTQEIIGSLGEAYLTPEEFAELKVKYNDDNYMAEDILADLASCGADPSLLQKLPY